MGQSAANRSLLIALVESSAIRLTEFIERAVGADVSGLMFTNFTTLAHFSVSSAISLPYSAGEPDNGVPPTLASRALILGSARPALISVLSLSMISAGVFRGAPSP